MPGVARAGDICGGAIIATATKTRVNGILAARLGDSIVSHGDSPHDSATMAAASTTVRVEGIYVCRVGDAGTCGDTVAAGSPTVNAG